MRLWKEGEREYGVGRGQKPCNGGQPPRGASGDARRYSQMRLRDHQPATRQEGFGREAGSPEKNVAEAEESGSGRLASFHRQKRGEDTSRCSWALVPDLFLGEDVAGGESCCGAGGWFDFGLGVSVELGCR